MSPTPATPPLLPARVQQLPTWLLARASARAQRLLAEAFARAGVRGYHYRLLAALDEAGPASQADLGRATAIDRSDVVAALNELADAGLVERAPDPADRRRNVITITPAGRRKLRTLDQAVADVQERLLAPLPAADRRRLVALLSRLGD